MTAFNKDAAIIAQNATTPAANLAAAIITANPAHATTTESALALFDAVREHIYNGSLLLAGVDSAVEFLGATPTAPAARPSGGGGGRGKPSGGRGAPASGNAGETVVNMGKHRDKTIADIHGEDPEYVTWMADKCSNDFLKRQAKAFLAG